MLDFIITIRSTSQHGGVPYHINYHFKKKEKKTSMQNQTMNNRYY